MAIKERKQITGTEAQIKGYAGHNGVLAYATDTKHLHVLSGTAGTTTKLANVSDIPAPVDISGKADKTYVDTELAKKQAKGDYATNTALTQGLAGKEDKGVCLPLTGGILTGALRFTEDTYIRANIDETTKGLEVSGGASWEDGAGLFLRNNSATGEGESGQWGLVAQDVTSRTAGVLAGRADNLWFNGGVVERANEFFGSLIEGGFYDVYRYATGLQIIIAGVTIPADQMSVTFTFPRPFINKSYSIAANAYTEEGDVAVTWALETTTSTKLYRKFYNGNFHLPSYIKCAFIGKWK